MRPASETPLNGRLGPHRRFDWLSMPLADFKAVAKALGCTVNDLVLATVAGAVREFLIARRVHPEEIDFRVSAPVSVRRDERAGPAGQSRVVVDPAACRSTRPIRALRLGGDPARDRRSSRRRTRRSASRR